MNFISSCLAIICSLLISSSLSVSCVSPEQEIAEELNPVVGVSGRVLDSEGLPMSGVLVSIASRKHSQVGELQDEMSGREGAVSGTQDGNGRDWVERNSVITDESGRFTYEVSGGLQYMVEVKTHDFYQSVIHPSRIDSEGGIITQNFKVTQRDQVAEDLVRIQILDEAGNKLRNVEIDMAPGYDSPWFRVFPRINTGQEGSVAIPWSRVGDRVVVTMRHSSWRGTKVSIATIQDHHFSVVAES